MVELGEKWKGRVVGPTYARVDDEVQKQWKTVFWIGAGLCYFGAAFYLVFASGKVQSWNTSTTAKRGLITRLVNDGE